MEEKEINALASAYIPYYKGVYAIDTIPLPTPNRKNAYVVNILNSKSEKKIGHWIALIVNPNSIFLLDPAGKYSIRNKHLKKYIEKIGHPVTTNFHTIQTRDSWNCGVYVLCFLYHNLVLNKSFASFLNMYRNKENPDKDVCRNFTKYFKIKCKNVVRKRE